MRRPLYPAFLTIILTLAILAIACGSATATPAGPPTRAWYEGGTLHSSSVATWKSATDANRLATAGDWVTVLTTYEDLDEGRVLAEDLVECVNESVEAAPDTMQAAELGVACAILMGWEPAEE